MKASAQLTYKTAAGLEIDFGKGTALVGPTIKNFFSNSNALEVDALLGSNYFSLGAFYQYHFAIVKTSPVKFYLGAGPEIFFSGQSSDTNIALRPMAGLDYKIKPIPVSITFDYKPVLLLTGQSDFNASRFGIGVRYAFR